jgi:hypothetical protein
MRLPRTQPQQPLRDQPRPTSRPGTSNNHMRPKTPVLASTNDLSSRGEHSRSNQPSEAAQKPENIAPNPPRIPKPYHNVPQSPSASHKSIIAPPDNFIPTKTRSERGEEFISLPPPHELSRPPSTVMDNREVETQRWADRDKEDRQRFATHSEQSRASRASTRISEYDIVSPPRGGDLRNGGPSRYTNGIQTPTRTYTPGPVRGRTLTPTERMVEQWRSQNSSSDPGSNRASATSPTPSRRFKVVNPDRDEAPQQDVSSLSPHNLTTTYFLI